MAASTSGLTEIEQDIRDALTRRAAAAEGGAARAACVDYNELAADIDPMISDRELETALRHVDEHEATAGRPVLSAFVIDGMSGNLWNGPSGPVFDAAQWPVALDAAVGYWRVHAPELVSAKP